MCLASLKSTNLNYSTIMATREEALDVEKESELKAKINIVATKMNEFEGFLYNAC